MLQPISFLDVSRLTASYLTKYKAQAIEGELHLRDAEGRLPPQIEGWKGADSLLLRMQNATASYFGGMVAPVVGAVIMARKARTWNQWVVEEADYSRQVVRTITTMVPSPGAIVHCGTYSATLPVGQVTAMNIAEPHCIVNFGTCTAVWLIVDFKKPDVH